MTGATTTDAERTRVAAWRADTPGCEQRVHLNNAGAALVPRSVSSAIVDHIALESSVGGYEAADLRRAEIDRCYEHIAALCSTRPANIAVTASATAAFIQAASARYWIWYDV